jgi:hypothetical protein
MGIPGLQEESSPGKGCTALQEDFDMPDAPARSTRTVGHIIETEYGMVDGQLAIPSRQALVKYVLQRYQIDPKNLNAKPEPSNCPTSSYCSGAPTKIHKTDTL